MSFQFNWPEFDQAFIEEIKATLTTVLNEGDDKPLTIADKIVVIDFSPGNQAPYIEILEVARISTEAFKASFKIRYDGDAYLTFRTKVQANPIGPTTRKNTRNIMKRLGFLCAHRPFIVPMDVTIKDINFAGVLNVNVSAADPPVVDVAFKTDPLQSVRIVSTFDAFSSARQLVQGMVEGQLRNFLTVELPKIAKEFEPQLRKLTENIPELQKANSEREGELLRRRTLLQEEDAARRGGDAVYTSPFRQPFSPPSQSPLNAMRGST